MLRRRDAITEHEAEHGEEEHAEGHEALLAVLELKGTDTQAFDDAVEELAKVVNHHLTEEELTILNPAREEVAERTRAELGETFATERNARSTTAAAGWTARSADRRAAAARGCSTTTTRRTRRAREARRSEPGTARPGRRAAPRGRRPCASAQLGSAATASPNEPFTTCSQLPGASPSATAPEVERGAGQPVRHRP